MLVRRDLRQLPELPHLHHLCCLDRVVLYDNEHVSLDVRLLLDATVLLGPARPHDDDEFSLVEDIGRREGQSLEVVVGDVAVHRVEDYFLLLAVTEHVSFVIPKVEFANLVAGNHFDHFVFTLLHEHLKPSSLGPGRDDVADLCVGHGAVAPQHSHSLVLFEAVGGGLGHDLQVFHRAHSPHRKLCCLSCLGHADTLLQHLLG
mmetsp:Transcript_22993/g.53717  ORF Transcript_22993/g.53717 Transcript_22993/m.53717 type:complete len:203 (+) Transcript_22993:572-1180(+)